MDIVANVDGLRVVLETETGFDRKAEAADAFHAACEFVHGRPGGGCQRIFSWAGGLKCKSSRRATPNIA